MNLIEAKSKFEKSLALLSTLLLKYPYADNRGCPEFSAAYYAQPNTSEKQVCGFAKKVFAFLGTPLAKTRPEVARQIDETLGAAVVAASCYRTLKNSPAPVRTASSDSGRYSFNTEPAFKIAGPEDLREGDYLLVTYGPHGTQLIRVDSAKPGKATLGIRRLFNRGTRYACWRNSTISRRDPRILGRSAPVPQDPKAF